MIYLSFKKQQEYGVYRENLSFQQQIQKQMLVCMKAITEDEPRFIRSSVKGFMGLVTPNIADNYYFDSIDAIEKECNEKYMVKYNVYLEECKKADCNDVIDEPNDDETVYEMLEKYAAVQALFERKGLLLEEQIDEEL